MLTEDLPTSVHQYSTTSLSNNAGQIVNVNFQATAKFNQVAKENKILIQDDQAVNKSHSTIIETTDRNTFLSSSHALNTVRNVELKQHKSLFIKKAVTSTESLQYVDSE